MPQPLVFATIPQKRLLQGITSSSSTFYLNNILSFDGVTNVTSADLGTAYHFCAFRNDTGTVLELMKIDPSTISAGPITILKRGLSFYGDLSTEDTDLKLDWPANTIVMLGTDVPQLFQWLKEYVDDTAFAGAPDATTSVKGIVEMATDAEVIAGTGTGGTGAKLVVGPDTLKTNVLKISNKTTTTTSSATPTINTDTYNRLTLTAQDTDITSMTTNLSGTPSDGDKLDIRITTLSSLLTFINSASYSGSSGSPVVNKPTNTADRDIMFAIAQCYGGTVTTLSGWTLVGGQGYAVNGSNAYLYYKVASGEGSSYTWTFGNSIQNKISIVTYRGGFNTTTPSPTSSNTGYTTNNAVSRAAYISIPYNNSPVFFFAANEDSYSWTKPTSPTNTTWTEDFDNSAFTSVSTVYPSKSDISGTATYIDATLSSSSQQKAAWLLALNPTLSITWGTKFTSPNNTLPTYLDFNKDYDFEFRYNSTLAKWELVEPTRPTINMDSISKDVSSTTTTTIPHYLGSKPKLVRISGSVGSSSSICTTGASYTTFQRSWYAFTESGTGTTENYGPNFRLQTASGAYLEGTITTDSTNITITWAKTSTPTGTADLVWEAFI